MEQQVLEDKLKLSLSLEERGETVIAASPLPVMGRFESGRYTVN
jgi:hypothetical protein